MAKQKIAVVAAKEPDFTLVEKQLEGLDYEMEMYICTSHGETIEAIKGADIIITQVVPMPREVIEEIDTAKAIVSFGHGFDRIDHDAATEKGVMLVNSAGFCSEEVSSHTIMMLLACAKDLNRLNKMTKAGEWSGARRPFEIPLVPIDGQTLGIVGLGNIGRPTARKAQAMGLNVISYDPYVKPWVARELGVELMPSLDALAQKADFVCMLVPLNNETRGLASAAMFKAMKPTAYFINCCRGPVQDEKALIKALQDKSIAGAGIDVFEQEPTSPDNPLLKMDNVIVTPHTAGTSTRSTVQVFTQVGQETARLLRGTWPMSLVNPEVRAQIPVRALAQQHPS